MSWSRGYELVTRREVIDASTWLTEPDLNEPDSQLDSCCLKLLSTDITVDGQYQLVPVRRSTMLPAIVDMCTGRPDGRMTIDYSESAMQKSA